MRRLRLLATSILMLGYAPMQAWGQAFKASATAMSFTCQVAAAALPSAQTLSITGGAASSPISFISVVTASGGNWLTMTPVSGRAPVSAKCSMLMGPNVITAVIPHAMLSTAGTLQIVASNPGADGGDSALADFNCRSGHQSGKGTTPPTVGRCVTDG